MKIATLVRYAAATALSLISSAAFAHGDGKKSLAAARPSGKRTTAGSSDGAHNASRITAWTT
jgi:hypothetical protein